LKPNQAVKLKQGVLANLANTSKESLDTDVSVGVDFAPGFGGAGNYPPRSFAHACPAHAFVSGGY